MIAEQEQTALTLPERAQIALGAAEHEKKLIELVKASADIKEIKNADGRAQVHTAYMNLKNSRIAVEKASKTATEDAKAFSKAVTAEERRLIAITEAEETRLQTLRDSWDEAIEAEKQRKIVAERARVTAIRKAIDRIAGYPLTVSGKPSGSIRGVLEPLRISEISEPVFQEFLAEAESAKQASIAKLESMLADAEAQEAEAQRIAEEREAERQRLEAERAELARQRAENEAAKAALKAEQDKANKEAADQAAALETERIAIERERAELDRQRQAEVAAHALTESQQEQAASIPSIPVQELLDVPKATIKAAQPVSVPTLRLGQICERLSFTVSADFLRGLGFESTRERSAVLYHEQDFPAICAALIQHIQQVQAKQTV
jgi:hypothetical protein